MLAHIETQTLHTSAIEACAHLHRITQPTGIALDPYAEDIEAQLLQYGYTPYLAPDYDPASHKLGAIIPNGGVSTSEVIAKTPEEIRAETVPMSISRRQGDLILFDRGLYDTVQVVISSLPMREQIEATTASTYERTNPLLCQVCAAAGMTDAQVDQMFIEASAL